MSRIVEQILKDGSHLELYCLRFPGFVDVPEWVKCVFGAPEAYGWAKAGLDGKRYLNITGWERYYHDVFSGVSADECTDYLYAPLVDGVPAGRIWFGFSNRTGCGNFGNTVTFPEFRRRGIMSIELQEIAKDFAESNALFISCGAAQQAAAGYAAFGFQRILGAENHAMALVKPEAGTFADIVKRAYGNGRNAVIRSGKRGDRFELDKLLAYTPEIEFQRVHSPNLLREWVPNYMQAFQRVCLGRSALSVIESASGFCAGYAYAEKCLPGITAVIFTVHPSFSQYLVHLLNHVTEGLDEHLMVTTCVSEAICREVLLGAGFMEKEAGLFEIIKPMKGKEACQNSSATTQPR